MYSLVIPVFKNEGSLPELLEVLADLDEKLGRELEVVFVVDGSPDRCAEILEAELPRAKFRSKLVLLSRNFGAFAAVRAGLAEASGPWFAVMAADLQEPPELVLEFFRTLEKEPVDVVIGTRTSRDDPALSRWSSQLFWFLYRRLVQPEMPPGGVDVFGCNRAFRDHLLALHECNSTLVGLLFWLGFRRKLFPYERRARRHGRSAWTLGRRLRYLSDSLFAFSDLPVRLLIGVGIVGLAFSLAFGIVVLVARLSGWIFVPGYAATILVITFFAALNSFGLGVIGSYLWRAFENTKGRPQSIVRWRADFGGERRE
jgi:glycosyltransferase involved in cell wall biosynthesis